MAARVWTCQRQQGGEKCGHVNPRRLQKCAACGKRRPPTREPAHRAVLRSLSYEEAIRLNGGEHCAICGTTDRGPAGRRFHRDHEHSGDGTFRGLLCWNCNKRLPHGVTSEWLRAAADYLARAEERAAA
jgi:hypothetical protein